MTNRSGMSRVLQLSTSIALVSLATPSLAQDWPVWGHDGTRNMATRVTGLPDDFVAGDFRHLRLKEARHL